MLFLCGLQVVDWKWENRNSARLHTLLREPLHLKQKQAQLCSQNTFYFLFFVPPIRAKKIPPGSQATANFCRGPVPARACCCHSPVRSLMGPFGLFGWALLVGTSGAAWGWSGACLGALLWQCANGGFQVGLLTFIYGCHEK